MSQENVEIVRKALDALNARDRDLALSLMDPEIEFRTAFVPALAPKTYRGLEGVVRLRKDLAAAFEDFHMEDIRFLDAGGDRVVALYRIVGRGAGSGVPVSLEVGVLWQIRDGKLLKARSSRISERPSKPPGCRGR